MVKSLPLISHKCVTVGCFDSEAPVVTQQGEMMMVRKILSASVATALMFGSISPAYAQAYMDGPQAPLGMTASLNLKVPLGQARESSKKPTAGFTLAYGQRTNTLTSDNRIATRQMKLADLRFTQTDQSIKLAKAEFASFDLANLEKDKRLTFGPDGGSTTWIVLGVVAAGVLLWLVLDNDDDDDDDTTA